jgi:hypothetical protein
MRNSGACASNRGGEGLNLQENTGHGGATGELTLPLPLVVVTSWEYRRRDLAGSVAEVAQKPCIQLLTLRVRS